MFRSKDFFFRFYKAKCARPKDWVRLRGSVRPILRGSVRPILRGSVRPILRGSVRLILRGSVRPILRGSVRKLSCPNTLYVCSLKTRCSCSIFLFSFQNNSIQTF